MSWEDAGYWTPVVHHPVLADQGRLVDALARRLSGESSINPAWMVAPDLTLSISQFRDSAAHARRRANPDNRDEVDYLAAFGSEAHGIGPKRSQISMTPFRCLAGQQRFLDFIRELASGTTVEHLDRTLFHPWDYGDGPPSMRWDPADYRPHALRAKDPSKDPIRTMRGANRLAIEALPLFPAVPLLNRLATVGFTYENGEVAIRWPIWKVSLDLDSARSLLSADFSDRSLTALDARGIVQVFRSIRFKEGDYSNFSPAKALM